MQMATLQQMWLETGSNQVKACKDKLNLVRYCHQRIKPSMISFFEPFADQIHNRPKIIKDKVSVPADAIQAVTVNYLKNNKAYVIVSKQYQL